MHAPHVQHGLRPLFADLVVHFLDQRGRKGFQWPDLVRQAEVHSPPVAGSGQGGDGIELRW